MPDKEPKFSPQQFVIDLEFNGGAIGATAQGDVSLNDRPFVLQLITHSIITDPNVVPPALIVQDGQYRIMWSIQNQIRFQKGSMPHADIAFGSVRNGIWIPLPAPATLPAQETLHIDAINGLLRDHAVTIQVIFHGLERMDLAPSYGTPAG